MPRVVSKLNIIDEQRNKIEIENENKGIYRYS